MANIIQKLNLTRFIRAKLSFDILETEEVI